MNDHYRVRLAPSGAAGICIAIVGIATLVLLWATPIDPLVKSFAAGWVGCATLEACRRIALLRAWNSPLELILTPPRALQVLHPGGRSTWGELRDGSFVAPFLTVIRWRPAGARFDRTIVLLPDMVEPESFRRLRVQLRWT